MGREIQKGGVYVDLRLSHAEVSQKRIQFCKAINLQLKQKPIKNKRCFSWSPSFSAGPGCEDRRDGGGNSVGNRLTPSGSRQVSLVHLGVWLSQGKFQETCMASIFVNNECVVLTN